MVTKKAPESLPVKRLYRSEDDQVIGGVAAGLAEYFDTDPTIVRIIFILMLIFGGSGFLLYVILWVVVPPKSKLESSSKEFIKHNSQEIKVRAQKATQGLTARSQASPNLTGALLIIFGLFILVNNFGMFDWFSLQRFWPLFLVILGIVLLRR